MKTGIGLPFKNHHEARKLGLLLLTAKVTKPNANKDSLRCGREREAGASACESRLMPVEWGRREPQKWSHRSGVSVFGRGHWIRVSPNS